MATCGLDPAEVERARRALQDCLKPMPGRELDHFDDRRVDGQDVVLEAQDSNFLWDLVRDHPGVVALAPGARAGATPRSGARREITRSLWRVGAPVPVATARVQPTLAKLPGAEFNGEREDQGPV